MRYHPFVQPHLLFMTALIMTTKDHNYLLKMVKKWPPGTRPTLFPKIKGSKFLLDEKYPVMNINKVRTDP